MAPTTKHLICAHYVGCVYLWRRENADPSIHIKDNYYCAVEIEIIYVEHTQYHIRMITPFSLLVHIREHLGTPFSDIIVQLP